MAPRKQQQLLRESRRSTSKTESNSSDNPKKRMKRNNQAQQSTSSSSTTESHQVMERSPVDKAFQNPMLLMMIMKMLKVPDLLNCRVVSKSWNYLASSILLKRKDIQVSFIFYKPTKNNRNSNNNNNSNSSNDGNNVNQEIDPSASSSSSNPESSFVLNRIKILTLNQFNNVLVQSNGFPCVNFRFKGNLKDPDSQKFLTIFGSQIKRLELVHATNLVNFRKLLIHQAPNIEYLSLDSWGKKNVPSLFTASQKQVKLLKLKFFTFYDRNKNHLPLAQAFLDKSLTPNLEHAEIFLNEDDVDFTSLVSSDRLSLFKQPNFNIRNIEELNAFDKFVNSQNNNDNNNNNNISHNNMQLKNIGLCASYLNNSEGNLDRLADIFSNILLYNQKSLKSICLNPPLEYSWTAVKWPETMENLNSLCLHLRAPEVDQNELNNNVEPIKQSPFILSTSRFPNLNSVTIKGGIFKTDPQHDEFYSHLISTYFPFEFLDKKNNTLDTVEHFRIYGNCSLNWMNKFTSIFPNVHRLTLCQVTNFPSFGNGIWKFSKLKYLKLDFELSEANNATAIDSTFTGLDELTCEFLQSSGKDVLELSQVEKLRKNPSILDVKDLKQVDLVIVTDGIKVRKYYDSEDSDEEEEGYENIISPVSGKYGFSLLSGLEKVCISVEPYGDVILPGNQLYANQLHKIHDVLAHMSPYVTIIPPK